MMHQKTCSLQYSYNTQIWQEAEKFRLDAGDYTPEPRSQMSAALAMKSEEGQAELQTSEQYAGAWGEKQQLIGRIMASERNKSDISQSLLSQHSEALTSEDTMLRTQVIRSPSYAEKPIQAIRDYNPSQKLQNSQSKTLSPEQSEGSYSSTRRVSMLRINSARSPVFETLQAGQQLPGSPPPRPDLEVANALLQQECDRLQVCWGTATAELKSLEHELAYVKELYTNMETENASLRRKLCTLEEHMGSSAVLTRDNSKSLETSLTLLESEKIAAEAEHQRALREVEALHMVYTNLSEKYEQLMMQFEQTKLKLQKTMEESGTQVKILTLRLKAAEDLVVQRDSLQAVFVKQVHSRAKARPTIVYCYK